MHTDMCMPSIRKKGMLALNARVVNRDWYEAEKHDMAGWHIENIKAEANL